MTAFWLSLHHVEQTVILAEHLRQTVAQMREALEAALKLMCEHCPDSDVEPKCDDSTGCSVWVKVTAALQSTRGDYHNPADVRRIAELTDELEEQHPCENCKYAGWLCGDTPQHRKTPAECVTLNDWKKALGKDSV